jgi:hypothetical protein
LLLLLPPAHLHTELSKCLLLVICADLLREGGLSAADGDLLADGFDLYDSREGVCVLPE